MKLTKILTLFLALSMLFSLSACGEKDPDHVSVYYLTGTTGFGMAKLMKDYSTNTAYTYTS